MVENPSLSVLLRSLHLPGPLMAPGPLDSLKLLLVNAANGPGALGALSGARDFRLNNLERSAEPNSDWYI